MQLRPIGQPFDVNFSITNLEVDRAPLALVDRAPLALVGLVDASGNGALESCEAAQVHNRLPIGGVLG